MKRQASVIRVNDQFTLVPLLLWKKMAQCSFVSRNKQTLMINVQKKGEILISRRFGWGDLSKSTTYTYILNNPLMLCSLT